VKVRTADSFSQNLSLELTVAKAPDDFAIHKWNELMSRWNIKSRNYEAAAAELRNSPDDRKAELASALSMSMQELKELKREIDQLIRHARHNRLQLPGTLLMGTIEPSQPALEVESSPQDSFKSGKSGRNLP
jgi:hypothetical protein